MSKRQNVFAERDEALHAPRRPIANQVYSMTNVLESERYVDQVTTTFPRRMNEFAAAHTEFGLCEWLDTADVVGEPMFGRPLGALAQRPRRPGVPILEECAVAAYFDDECCTILYEAVFHSTGATFVTAPSGTHSISGSHPTCTTASGR